MYQYSARGATGGSFRAKLLISQRMEFAWLVLTVALSVSSLSCVFACWLLGHPACPCATFPDCEAFLPERFCTKSSYTRRSLQHKPFTPETFHKPLFAFASAPRVTNTPMAPNIVPATLVLPFLLWLFFLLLFASNLHIDFHSLEVSQLKFLWS